jgi:alkanesulfonate monooxygenase SsuD/methylene tetrahydromethanopterin reductase-like flavin-dependent oxidoreductase (luciferase family)
MLSEAVEIIRALSVGDYLNYAGHPFRTDSAKLCDVPHPPPRIALAASGTQSGELAAPIADALIAIKPCAELIDTFDAGVRPGTTPEPALSPRGLGRHK